MFVIIAACVHVELYAMIVTYLLVAIFWLTAEDASNVSVTNCVSKILAIFNLAFLSGLCNKDKIG